MSFFLVPKKKLRNYHFQKVVVTNTKKDEPFAHNFDTLTLTFPKNVYVEGGYGVVIQPFGWASNIDHSSFICFVQLTPTKTKSADS